MIKYQKYTLANGLKLLIHQDRTTPMAVVNILYNTGSRDESSEKTGFAHLFEHLMFGGSKNIPSFDEPLQTAGGENNAFTSPDITNYYITLPASNLETAFWLESDRMESLSFDPQVLEVQRNVVIEEFKQRYLNQPYGDVWLKLRPLAYKKHPYQWPTIGKEISHIENATMEDVKSFFYKYYVPSNANMVVAGNVEPEEVLKLVEKWFGHIPAGKPADKNFPMEDPQTEQRRLTLEADVPLDGLYIAFHMPGRMHKDYYAADLVCDILGRSKSSRLYENLVKKENVFNSLNAYVTGSIDPGLLVIQGKVNKEFSIEQAEKKVFNVIQEFLEKGALEKELEKVKNQAESTLVFSETELLNRAMNLSYAEVLGDPELINREVDLVREVNNADISRVSKNMLTEKNSSILYYKSKK